jgi:type II secretory pathway component PulL
MDFIQNCRLRSFPFGVHLESRWSHGVQVESTWNLWVRVNYTLGLLFVLVIAGVVDAYHVQYPYDI